ncbi:MAG: pyrroline-5-carboxylate reductase [Sphingomonadales bacterium]|nr:MAG: pyrroline-5-carboxylate reductase [Sphingomonadales bacterium]
MNVLLVGCGRMGGAMARGWAGHRILVFDPVAALPEGAERVETLDPAQLPEELVVVLAVKPQTFPGLAPALAPLAPRGALFLSIMAGMTLSGMSAALGGTRRIVRAMPNTPAAIGRGITAAVADADTQEADRATVTALLKATGALVWLESEGDLDAVTALSGSGPAYFFRFTEAMARAGTAAGLAEELAMQLARATFIGAAALAEAEPASLALLREQVTSPGGTTAAGLAEMEAIDGLATQVIAAAAARSRALAG